MRNSIVTEDALKMWHKDLYSMQMIADVFEVSTTAVRRYLRKHGVDTSKAASKQTVVCNYCNKEFTKNRCNARKTRKHYCSHKCYHADLKNPNYIRNNMSSRKARAAIRDVGFHLSPTDIVHHIDGNGANNDINNLMVFRSQADHLRWHREDGPRSGVIPLFPKVYIDGRHKIYYQT